MKKDCYLGGNIVKEIVFVTGNKGKQVTAQKHFDESKIKVVCYDYDIIELDVNNIEAIAKDKVIQAYKKIGKPCIALDAGFYIPNYPNDPNFPGAFPKRELLDKIGIDGLLENMKDVDNRECYFRECLAYYDGKEISLFFGMTDGTLAYKKQGENLLNKWSDLWLVFIPDNCTKTLAEMSEDEFNNRPDNHTSAFKEFSDWYKNIVG